MQLWQPRSLSSKLVLYIVTATCALLIATVWVSYDTARRRLEEQTRSEAKKQVQATASTLDSYVDRVAGLIRGIAARQESIGREPDANTISYLSHLLDAISPEEAYGVFVAFSDAEGGLRAMQWVDRASQPNAVAAQDDSRNPAFEWYQGPLTSGKLHVSEPVLDRGGSTALLVCVSKPFFDADNRRAGIVGADLTLDLIQAIVSQIRFRPDTGSTGEYAFLITRKGEMVSHPSLQPGQFRRANDIDEGLLVADSPEGWTVTVQNGERRHVSWSTAPLTGWKIALNIPESVILAPARALAVRTAAVATLSVAGMIALVLVVARRVIDPVRRLTHVTAEVAAENYELVEELAVSAGRHDELGQLARGFQTMVKEVSTRETRLKQAEEVLARREMYFRSLIESTTDVVAIFDATGRVLYASPSCTKVLGMTPENYVGQNGFATLAANNGEIAAEALRDVVATPSAIRRLELMASHPDGSTRIVEITLHNLLENPAVKGVVVNLRDSTERKQMESLAKEKDAAQAASQAKSAFLASMSHELRTPLNAIIGYSEMLSEEADESMAPDLLKIRAAGKHLLELINAVLDISKIEAGKMELFLETFPVDQMMHDVAAIVQPLAQKNGNKLIVSIGGGLGSQHADLTKVRQTLFNLLSNACKFTQNGEVELAADRRGNALQFRVRDTGIGMTPEQASKLFQAFAQADASIAGKFGGTGLGLVISQSFCHMMGGDISLQSAPGQGTTFTVTLPVQVVMQKPLEKTPTEPEPAAGPLGTVLVVDDDATVHDVVRRSLSKEGYRVMAAASGEEAFRIARQNLPDLITLDAMMPGEDGWAVLRRLKADPDLAAIPVVMMTIIENRSLAFSLGAVDYLTKPIGRDQLLTAVQRRVRKRGVALVVEDDPASRELLARVLQADGWQFETATGAELPARPVPAIVLLDVNALRHWESVREQAAWRAIPMVLFSDRELTLAERSSGVQVLMKGRYSADDVRHAIAAELAAAIRKGQHAKTTAG